MLVVEGLAAISLTTDLHILFDNFSELPSKSAFASKGVSVCTGRPALKWSVGVLIRLII